MPKSRRAACIGLTVTLAVIGAFIGLLYELQRAPYRPPYDMSTFLGAGEIEFVRAVIGMFAVIWVGCAFALALLVWLGRRRHRG
jgi:hypothetical protein